MLSAEELRVDVTDAAGLGTPAATAVSLHRPEGEPTVVCIAFPGGGYSRRYWTFGVDGADDPGQAAWHAARGWAVAAVDTLGVGDATIPEPDHTSLETIAAVNASTVGAVLDHLGRPAVPVIGIGQSMGGAFVVVTQAHERCFDGVAALGSSAIQTVVPAGPGRAMPLPWVARTGRADAPTVLGPASDPADLPEMGGPEWRWAFHHDDEDPALVDADLAGMAGGPLPPWRSAAVPACAMTLVTPGIVAAEAAAIDVPVFVGVGERDVVPDPRREPEAYRSSPDITVVVTPRMAHMHNFAPTRHRLWARLHAWGGSISRR